MRRGLLVGGALLAVGVFASCQTILTPNGSPYTFTTNDGSVTVSANSMAGGNNRELFFAAKSPDEANPTVCATFSGGQGLDQPGIAMRISNDAQDAITVTENVFGDAENVFNIGVWSPGGVVSTISQTKIPTLAVFPGTYPLNMCARITGGTVQFVVWTTGAQPTWGEWPWGGQAQLPSTAPQDGLEGFYVGHLVPSTTLDYSNMTIDGAPTIPVS